MTKDEQYMQESLIEARKAYELGEIPIGGDLGARRYDYFPPSQPPRTGS